MKKLFSFVATLSLLINSLFAPISILAEESFTSEPTATPTEETITPSDNPLSTPTASPDIVITNEATPTPTPEEVISETTPPSAPTGIVIYKGHVTDPASEIGAGGYTNTTQIRITWNPNTESDVDYYWFGTKSNPHHKKVYDIFYDANMTPGNNPYYYTVSTVDKTGNESLLTTSYQIILDMNAPSIPVLSWPTGGVYINDNTPLMQWQASIDDQSGVAGYNYQVYYNCSNLTDIPNSCTNHYLHSSLITNHQLQAGSTPDNTYYWQVRAKDNAGNIGEWSSLEKVIIDTVAPQIPTGLTRFTPNGLTEYVCGTTVQRQTLIPTWDAYIGSDFDHYEYTSFNPNGSIGLNEQSLTTNKFVHTWVPTSDGTYGYAVRTVDKAGNKSGWALTGKTLSGSCQITYDSTPPNVPTLVSPDDGAFVKGNPTQSWNSVNDAHHYVYESYYDYEGNNKIYPTTTTGTSRTVGGMQTITFYWRVKAVDAVGNESDWSEMRKLTVDNTLPGGSWVYPTNDSTISGTISLNFAATDTNSGVASVVYQYKADDGVDTFHDITGSTWDTTALPLGNYILRAVVTDNAGNVSGNSGEFDITVGVAAVISSQNAIGVTGGNIVVTWTTDRPTTSRVVYDTVSHPDLGTGDNYGYAFSTIEDTNKVTSHSVTITGLGTGVTYYYRVISHGSPTAIGGEGYAITLTNAGPPEVSGGTTGVLGTTTGGLLAGAFPQLAITSGNEEDVENETVETGSGNPSLEPEVLGAETEASDGIGGWIKTHMGLSLGIATLIGLIIFFIIKKSKKKNE